MLLEAFALAIAVPRTAADARTPPPPPAVQAEKALLGRYPEIARRRGDVLTVGRRTYRTVRCGNDRPDHCSEYRLDAVFPGGIVGIDVGHYEGGDYLLTDGSTELFIGARPMVSPDGRYLLAAHFAEAHETSVGVALVPTAPSDSIGALVPIRTVSPDALVDYRDLRWLTPGCASFVAADPRTGWGGAKGDRWYLVEARPEWRLTTVRDPVCGTAAQ